jgi:hypothetical protein
MASMHKVKVQMSKNQGRKALRGGSIQLSKHQLKSSQPNIELVLHPANARKLEKAMKANKGCRLQLSPAELEGAGILDWLKSAGNWIKSNIIDKPFYQTAVKPLVRGLVDVGTSMVPGGIAQDVVKKGADWIGRETGAFGLKKGKKTQSVKRDFSRLIDMQHPAMQSPPAHLPPIGGRGKSKKSKQCPHCGGGSGSFLPAGY